MICQDVRGGCVLSELITSLSIAVDLGGAGSRSALHRGWTAVLSLRRLIGNLIGGAKSCRLLRVLLLGIRCRALCLPILILEAHIVDEVIVE